MKKKFNFKFANLVVKGKWVFFALFIALTVFGAVMIPKTNVLFDLRSYAPKNSNTQQSVAIMKTEFDDKGSLYVMVKGVTIDDANLVQSEIAKIAGVNFVTYDQDNDFKNGSVLYTISLKDYDATDGANEAVKNIINNLSQKEAYLSGQSAMSYYTRLEMVNSIMKVGIILALIIVAMLIFTSKTYFEIVLMLFVFGVSVVINMGTNFLFGGISYLSHLVSIVLQLALSLDYSVILLHRFMEERETADAKDAAVTALKKAIPEILSSSLTTIAGLCALMLMTLPIGVELGISLSKGIVVSLLSVIFFMPGLLVIFSKPLDKTKHKSFVPNVKKPSRTILKGRFVIVALFAVIVILSGTGQFFNKYSFNINGAESIVSSNEKIAEEFGVINDLVVIVPKGDYVKEQKIVDYMMSNPLISDSVGLCTIEAVDGLKLIDKVKVSDITALSDEFGMNEQYATTLFNMYISANEPDSNINVYEYEVVLIDLLEYAYEITSELNMTEYENMLSQLVTARLNFEGENYSRIMFNISSHVESDESMALIDELNEGLKQFGEFYLAGESVACRDMALVFPLDNLYVNLFTASFILLILLFTFKNLLMPIILTLAIQGGVWINFVLPFLAGDSISFIAFLLISAIQMGATIDYAIVLTNRYQSTKHSFSNKLDAMANSENSVYSTIITSGTILSVTGFALGFAASGIVARMGLLLGVGALTSMFIVLFVLPSLLIVTDKLVEKASFSFIRTAYLKSAYKKSRRKKSGVKQDKEIKQLSD